MEGFSIQFLLLKVKFCSKRLKSSDWLGQNKTFYFFHWWMPLSCKQYILGHEEIPLYLIRVHAFLQQSSWVTSPIIKKINKLWTTFRSSYANPSHDIPTTMLDQWTCMFGLMSRFFLSPQYSLSISSSWSERFSKVLATHLGTFLWISVWASGSYF